MKKPFLMLVLALGLHIAAFATEGEVIKVLPHFLDLKGRHALSPSLFERDAYQSHLRKHPGEVSGVRFDLHWKISGDVSTPLKLRIEVRSSNDITVPVVRQIAVEKPRFGGRWSAIELVGKDYADLGEILAWRATLLAGDQTIGEQKSFLW